MPTRAARAAGRQLAAHVRQPVLHAGGEPSRTWRSTIPRASSSFMRSESRRSDRCGTTPPISEKRSARPPAARRRSPRPALADQLDGLVEVGAALPGRSSVATAACGGAPGSWLGRAQAASSTEPSAGTSPAMWTMAVKPSSATSRPPRAAARRSSRPRVPPRAGGSDAGAARRAAADSAAAPPRGRRASPTRGRARARRGRGRPGARCGHAASARPRSGTAPRPRARSARAS